MGDASELTLAGMLTDGSRAAVSHHPTSRVRIDVSHLLENMQHNADQH